MTTFLVLFVAYLFSQFYRSFLAVVALDIKRDLGLGTAELGDLSAIWFAAFAFAQFPVGYGLDRWGARLTLSAGLAIAVVGSGWFAVATGYGDALAAMALIGIGCAPVLMAGMFLFGRLYPPDRFALAGTTLIGLGSVGNLAGALPLTWAAERYGWRASMLAIAAATAAVTVLLATVLRDPPRLPETQGDRSLLGGLRTIAAIRPIWILLPLACTSYACVIATRSLWIAPYLNGVQGLGTVALGQAALAMAVAMSVGALAYGPAEGWFRTKPTVLVGAGISAAGFLGLGSLGPGHAGAAVALLTAIGGFGLTYAILMGHAKAFMPPELLGRGITFMNFGFIGGAGVVQWISGRVVQSALDQGVPPATAFGHLFLAFGAILAVAAAIYAAAPSPPRPSVAPAGRDA